MKTMEQIETIRRLYADGDGCSRIAKEMHIDRKTVKKYVAMDDFNETVEDKIPRIVGSKLDPYKATINKLLEEEKASGVYHKQRFTAKRMHEYLVRECGASELENSYQLVQRYMNEQKRIAKRGLAKAGTAALVWSPGEAQGDFGEADFCVKGELVRYPYFTLAFPYSNRRISIVMPGENCECVCTALQEIFNFICGLPSRIVFDNATGIGRRVQNELELNSGFTRFKMHYGFAATFANPCSGWEKGSVENAVGTIRRNIFVPPMMINGDMMEFNRSTLLQKSFSFEEDKPHYKKGKTIAALWDEETVHLRALPAKEFKVNKIEHMKTNKVGALILNNKYIYNLGGDHASENVLVEKTAFSISIYTIKGEHIKTFDRLYGDPQETYDIDVMLRSLSYKAGSWLNSSVRMAMEDGPLKTYLDSVEDKKQLRRHFGVIYRAAQEFGFADACFAISKLLQKGHFPSSEDLSAFCSRMCDASALFVYNGTGVDLGVYDAMIHKGAR